MQGHSYKASLTLKSKITIIREINEKLSKLWLDIFNSTFGPWLDLTGNSTD